MAWWGGGNKQRDSAKSSKTEDLTPKSVEQTISSSLHVVQDAADVAVGTEQREAVRMENREVWGRVKEGDTLWSLSEKYLKDATKWPSLHAACKKELGPDPLRLLPGTHYVTEACVARAKELSRKSSRN